MTDVDAAISSRNRLEAQFFMPLANVEYRYHVISGIIYQAQEALDNHAFASVVLEQFPEPSEHEPGYTMREFSFDAVRYMQRWRPLRALRRGRPSHTGSISDSSDDEGGESEQHSHERRDIEAGILDALYGFGFNDGDDNETPYAMERFESAPVTSRSWLTVYQNSLQSWHNYVERRSSLAYQEGHGRRVRNLRLMNPGSTDTPSNDISCCDEADIENAAQRAKWDAQLACLCQLQRSFDDAVEYAGRTVRSGTDSRQVMRSRIQHAKESGSFDKNTDTHRQRKRLLRYCQAFIEAAERNLQRRRTERKVYLAWSIMWLLKLEIDGWNHGWLTFGDLCSQRYFYKQWETIVDWGLNADDCCVRRCIRDAAIGIEHAVWYTRVASWRHQSIRREASR